MYIYTHTYKMGHTGQPQPCGVENMHDQNGPPIGIQAWMGRRWHSRDWEKCSQVVGNHQSQHPQAMSVGNDAWFHPQCLETGAPTPPKTQKLTAESRSCPNCVFREV